MKNYLQSVYEDGMKIQLSKVNKYLLVLLITVSAFLISGQVSSSSNIENDFQDLQEKLPLLKDQDLLFLDPASALNYGDRAGKKVLMVIVHHTETSILKGTKDTLNARGLSIHFIVDRDGSITLMVPLEKEAWHAGISYARVKVDSKLEELRKLNNYSVGIEIVNTGLEPFPEEQMRSVKELILYLMERFKIKRDMIFSHSEIGTIVYDPELGYTMRKPDPHKLFDWELLEKNEIGLHISDRINPKDAKHKMGKTLYKAGDRNEGILKLKQRLNRFFYKIEPWNDKKGNVIFPDNNADYSDEFDENFVWVIYQFSIHNLPREIRKDLPLKLEQADIFPEFFSEYSHGISSSYLTFSEKIKSTLQPCLSKVDYENLLSSLAQYENNISPDASTTLMYKIKLYYDSYLRYRIWSSLYKPFKLNVLEELEILKSGVLSLKSLDSSKAAEVSSLIDSFKVDISLEFQGFEKQWFQEFKNAWRQEFIPSLEEQITWTALHEAILEYLEKAKEEIR
ncbi:N-acetylmuramoyl-L-alanine amidase [Wolbachia pipientis]|uniref:N-acetylmuramoyl-L-alanine amidase n=1 Tax=Wolbachia pipientis TaxID=955 RepID=UPI000AD24A3B|nr:N-acetylmuramoyl-L-alanine amidase [Wolbachia pipientis]